MRSKLQKEEAVTYLIIFTKMAVMKQGEYHHCHTTQHKLCDFKLPALVDS